MKLTCSQAALNSNLQCVSRAVAARPTHPVLANVLLTADEGTGKVSLTGFDLNLGIQTSFTAAVEQSGAITLPSRLFGDIVSRLSADSPLSLQSTSTPSVDSSSEQEGDGLTFQLTARTGAYTVRGMPAEDFPDLPMARSRVAIPLPIDSLRNGLACTLFAASSDEAKQMLTGVHLVVSLSGLEFAATDGHRLAVVKHYSNDNSLDKEGFDEGFSVTIPARSLRELDHLLASQSDDSIDLYHDQGQVVFLRADQVVTSRTLDGVYPKYNQLIPDTFSQSFIVNRFLLITALERVAVLADQQNSVVKFSISMAERQLQICADVQDVGRGNESVPLQDGEGDDMEVGFNVRYLLDGLKVLPTPDVRFQMNNPSSPVVLRPQGEDVKFTYLTYLVMPVQLSK